MSDRVKVESGDQLLVRYLNSLSGTNFTVTLDFEYPGGETTRLRFEYGGNGIGGDLNATRVVTSPATQALPQGWIVGISIIADAGRRGQLYVLVGLTSGTSGIGYYNTPIKFLFIKHYVTPDKPASWPGPDSQEDSLSGPGMLRSITGTNPAAWATGDAASNIAESTPTNARWRLKAARVQLVTSATTGNRNAYLLIDDGSTILHRYQDAYNQAASATIDYNWIEGWENPEETSQQITKAMAADLVLLQGWRIRIANLNGKMGDNWGAPQLEVEEWLEE